MRSLRSGTNPLRRAASALKRIRAFTRQPLVAVRLASRFGRAMLSCVSDVSRTERKRMPDRLTVKDARAIAGSLGAPSKMPGAGYGLPIAACNVGARLRAAGPGTNAAGYVNPCGSCYAADGHYRKFAKTILPAQHKRLESIRDPRWTDAMVVLIRAATRTVPYFRWHDSGDLQGITHLDKIVEIARALPDVRFWLPTREARLVKDWQELHGAFPSNLAVRISTMATPSARSLEAGRLFSTVSRGETPEGAQRCIASEPDTPTDCGSCRACWDTDVKWVDYRAHSAVESSVAKRAARS